MNQNDKSIKGSCLCGAVSYRVSGPFQAFHWCHCSRCRKDTGSAHASNLFAGPESLEWLGGQEQVRRFELPDAARFAKAFCTTCGSTLPYLNRAGTAVVVPAGTLDDAPGITPDDNIFWGSRAPWYEAGLKARKYETTPGD